MRKNVAIMGTGNIAAVMAQTLAKMRQVRCYAVASRSLPKAEIFAAEHGFKKAYGSYEELAADKKVDLIYIATPHSEHYANMKLCIQAGRPVLCEKAFTANAAQAQEILRMAEDKGVFVTEAIWTRYMPFRERIREVMDSGAIGEPTMLTANLGYMIDGVKRLQDPALAGGALLDVGVYPINFAAMLFEGPVAGITSECTYTASGVDEQDSITIRYEDGKMAVLNCSMRCLSDRKGMIYGTKGFLEVENINNFESLRVYDGQYRQVALYKRPRQISGYEYEVEASLKAIQEKRLECGEMTHGETLRIMRMLDSLRAQWGIRYPFEEPAETEDRSGQSGTEDGK